MKKMNKKAKELAKVLRQIYDSDDFVFGVLEDCHNEDGVEEMMKYIKYCLDHDLPVEYEDIVYLGLAINKRYEH